jgi:hypothetical protein
MLGEAGRIINRRDLVLENEEKYGSVPELHTCSGPDSHNEQKHWHSKCHYKRNSGSPSAGTNNPPPRGKACGATERPTGGSPPPVLITATTTLAPDRRAAAVQASGWALLQSCPRPRRRSRGEDKYENRRPGARMVAVIPSATGTSRAASASAPMAGDTSPPADPHSSPPRRVGHRPLREGAVPVQKQGHPRTRTLP